MAVAFSEEALRALQDAFPIYEAIRPEHASKPPGAFVFETAIHP